MTYLNSIKPNDNTWLDRLRKLSVPVGLILVSIGLSFFLPSTKEEAANTSSQQGILALVITKTIFASCGFTFAYLIKEVSFPFVSLQEMLLENHWAGVGFLALWYVACIYCFSLGG
jgi:hypothetical protein